MSSDPTSEHSVLHRVSCAPNQKQTKRQGQLPELSHGLTPKGYPTPSEGSRAVPETERQELRHGGEQGKRLGLPFLEPETLPGGEGLGGVLQHPEFVEEHHVEDDQQHQTGGD